MKAVNRGSRQGAIIGKAIAGLAAGQGLVLVLVSLQVRARRRYEPHTHMHGAGCAVAGADRALTGRRVCRTRGYVRHEGFTTN